MSKYEIILFDLDGTLTDSAPGITRSVQYALHKSGIEEPDLSKLTRFVGPPLADSFTEYYGFTKEQCELGYQYYRERYEVTGLYENSVYPGVQDALIGLKNRGMRLAVATAKPEYMAEQIIRHFHLEQYFDLIAGVIIGGSRTTKTQVIAYALEQLEVKDKSKVLMVGDRRHDIKGAIENEIDSVGVLYGYGSREELETAGATLIAEQAEDIVPVIIPKKTEK